MDDWRKSSYSGANGGSCVETASGSGAVLVRDTTDRNGVTLAVPADAWRALTDGIKAELEDPSQSPSGCVSVRSAFAGAQRGCQSSAGARTRSAADRVAGNGCATKESDRTTPSASYTQYTSLYRPV